MSTTASSSRPATKGTGGLTGGVLGGVGTGMALGSAALAFIPPLGVLAIASGAGIGAAVGDAAESRSRPLRYPETVSIQLRCGSAVDTARAPLGVSVRGLTLEEAAQAGLAGRTAVGVSSVAPEGRAAAAGLRQGDVIVALNELDLYDAADLEERLLALPDGAPIRLRVLRDRRVLDLQLIPRQSEP